MLTNQQLLQALEQTLLQVHPSLLQRLDSGLSTGEIDRIAASVQLNFTDDVYDLFSWKNGLRQEAAGPAAQFQLFFNGMPYTLSEAAGEYHLLSLTKHFFEPNYFPLFSGGNDDILLIDLDNDSETYAMISLYAPALLGNNNPVTIYDSFAQMIQTALACYQQNAYRVIQGSLDIDSDAQYNIASALNPNSGYWQFM